MLLGVQIEDACRIAANVYAKAPTNAAYATTYAYALLKRGDVGKALHIMQALPPEKLSDFSTSAYYGLCLAANSDQNARNFLEAGRKATLLPEEKALLDKALASLDSHRQKPVGLARAAGRA